MLLFAPIVTMVLGVLILLFSYVTEKDVKIVSMKVTNVSENSATVTWLSKTKDKGVVVVSENNDFGVLTSFSKAHYYDERDQVSGTLLDRYTHQVKITGLNPETKYYFRVTEGLKLTEYAYPALETAPTLNALVTPDPSYGSIKTGDLGDDVLIYSRFRGSTLGSSVVEANGSFSFDKTNYRTKTLDGRETYKDGDIIVFEVLTNEGVANYIVKIGEDKPFGLGELKDSLIKQTSLNRSFVSGVNAKVANDDGGGVGETSSSTSSASSSSSGFLPTVVTPEPAPACVPSCSNIQCGNSNSCGTGYCNSDCKAPEKPKTIESRPYENVSCDDLKDQCKGADAEACAEYGRKSCRTPESKLTATNADTRSESMKASGIPTTLEDCKSIKTKLEREECKADLDKEAAKSETIKNLAKNKGDKLDCVDVANSVYTSMRDRYPDEDGDYSVEAYNVCCEYNSCADVAPATTAELCSRVGLKLSSLGELYSYGASKNIDVRGREVLCATNSIDECKRISEKYTTYINGRCYTEEDKKKNYHYLWEIYGKTDTDKFCDLYYGLEGKLKLAVYNPNDYFAPVCVPKETSVDVCDMTFEGNVNPGVQGDVISPSTNNIDSQKKSTQGISSSIYIGVTKKGKCIKYDDVNGNLLLKKYKGEITKEYCEETKGIGFGPNPNLLYGNQGGDECIKVSMSACKSNDITVKSDGTCLNPETILKGLYSDEDCQDRYKSKDFRYDKTLYKCIPTSVNACNTEVYNSVNSKWFHVNYVKLDNGKCVSEKEEAESNIEKNKKATQSDCDGKYAGFDLAGQFKPRPTNSYSTEYCVPATVKACEFLKTSNPGSVGMNSKDKIIGVTTNGNCQVEHTNINELPVITLSSLITKEDKGFIPCSPTTEGDLLCKNSLPKVVADSYEGTIDYINSVKCAPADFLGNKGLCITTKGLNEKSIPQNYPAGGSLNKNLISPVKAASGVLGVSDGKDTSVKVDEKGTYKVTLNDSKVTLLSDKFTFTESSDGTYSGKFFLDTNFNGIKDANEEYYKDDLSLKVEKVGDLETYSLVSGWNLIGWNFAKSDVLTAKDFLVRVARSGGYATHMATYRNGEWKELSLRGDSEFGTNFNLLPTEGYFVKVITPTNVVVDGTKISKTDQVSVINGWNLMSFRPTKVTLASSMLDSVNSSSKYTLDTATRYESGRYENLVKDSTTTYGKDFNLEENKGYFIRALNTALVKKN